MSENYSRRNHSSKEEKKSAPMVTEHVTKGVTAFQKVLTAVGTILSIIVASITIMNFTSSKNKDTSDSSANQSTVMQLTQKQRQAAKLVITPILHQQTQQLVEIQLLLHPQPLQTQQLAIRQLATPQLVALSPTKTKKRLGNPCLFYIIL